jgi:hypothetical protein
MPSRTSPEKRRQYDDLRRFFEVWQTQLFPNPYFATDDPRHPLNVLTAYEQNLAFSKTFSGLKQAVNDCLEDAQDFRPEQIARIDDALLRAGAPSLSQLLTRNSRSFKAMLRRGHIRNDTEFYLVSATLSDTASARTDDETSTLGSMLAAYEAKQGKSSRGST